MSPRVRPVPSGAGNQGWHSRAKCGDSDPEIFFPSSLLHEKDAAAEVERTHCRLCPVRRECLEQAMALRSDGVWAGTTKSMRDALSRRRVRGSCAVCESRSLTTDDDVCMCLACGLSWKIPAKKEEQ